MKNKQIAMAIKKMLIGQFLFVMLISLLLLIIQGKKGAMSSLLGGVVAILPTMIFARKLFQYQGAQAARQIVKGFYAGEALKLLSTVVLFVLVFTLFKINSLVFFLTYIIVVLSHWFSPLFMAHRG